MKRHPAPSFEQPSNPSFDGPVGIARHQEETAMLSEMGRRVLTILLAAAVIHLFAVGQTRAQFRGRGQPQMSPPPQMPPPQLQQAGSKPALVSGTITAISGTTAPATVTITPSKGAAVTVNVTTSTKIVRNGQAATLADLQKNDEARAVYDTTNNNALVLEAHVKVSIVRGAITAISGTSVPAKVTITPTTGAAVTVTVTTNTKILRNGQTATLADLRLNDQAEVSYDANNNAVVLKAHLKVTVVRGTITAISGTTVPATVTITPATGTAVTVNVTASTKILRNRQPATLADLQLNDHAEATYDASNNAVVLTEHVKVSEVRGTITAISGTTLPATVTITPTSGAAVTVNVTASTQITRNRQTATLADLQPDDKAKAVYDSANNALVLEARGS
jgi:hypothetical protein